jgi:esterase/lipase
MFRTRFNRDILAEFLPPIRRTKRDRVIILCDGMPSIPRKQPLVEFLSEQGFWVFYPRYRGAWESAGQFLRRCPVDDIRDVIDGLSRPIREIAFRQVFKLKASRIYVIGGSFGGTTAILASLDRRVNRVIANCPVVNWNVLDEEQEKETSNANYAAYIREAFGNAYRLADRDWNKLRSGKFFNPVNRARELTGSKILMFHAKDDPFIPWTSVRDFADEVGARLKLLARGGHLRTEEVVRKHWREIRSFLES